jgi:aldose 1-epimerase
MNTTAKVIDYKGEDCIELVAGDYRALIAPFNGSNVMKLENTALNIDVFRNDPEMTPEELKGAAEVYGLPTLYLPNRLSKGVLKTSDAVYHFPCNDPLGNHLHGFLHLRNHKIVSVESVGDAAVAKTSYTYDENDEFYSTYPVSFRADFTFTLSADGLGYEFTLTNLSDRQMPYGVCNHVAFKGPFTPEGKAEDLRLCVPIGDKWELDEHAIPTEKNLPITDYDLQYKNGTMVPVLKDIDNDLYSAQMNELDGKPFYGVYITDTASGKRICYEVDETMKYWIMWNDHGDKEFFCPEPMSWNIDAPNLKGDPQITGYTELAPGESKTVRERIFTCQ